MYLVTEKNMFVQNVTEEMRFLIVEDNKIFRDELISIVTKENDEIFQCDDGIDVNLLYEAHHPEVVLMDIKMKKLNGLEATKKLVEKFPEAKVIIVSNYTDAPVKKRAEEYGASGFISKECLNELSKLIHGLRI